MQNILLDTGVIGLLLAEPYSSEINSLIEKILKKNVQPQILTVVLTEVFFHQCQKLGKEIAKIQISSLTRKLPIMQVELDENTIFLAGTLKCQNNKILSYIDCVQIAYCLNTKIPFHTTESMLKKIPENSLQRLLIVKYVF